MSTGSFVHRLRVRHTASQRPSKPVRSWRESVCAPGRRWTFPASCHAHRGLTPRTATLYRQGCAAYVYLCYGIHNLLNVVTGPEGHPQAVLIRGVAGAAGPGRVTRLLGVDRSLNGADLTASEELWLEEGTPLPFTALPRVGIGYASPEDQARLWRFVADT